MEGEVDGTPRLYLESRSLQLNVSRVAMNLRHRRAKLPEREMWAHVHTQSTNAETAVKRTCDTPEYPINISIECSYIKMATFSDRNAESAFRLGMSSLFPRMIAALRLRGHIK